MDALTSPSDSPVLVRRADYRPPDYLVPDVLLRFQLDARRTIVHSRARYVRRDPASGHGIAAPPLVLDYLVAHEMAHLREMNHSSRFWAVAHELCGHVDSAEAWLKRNGTELHRFG